MRLYALFLIILFTLLGGCETNQPVGHLGFPEIKSVSAYSYENDTSDDTNLWRIFEYEFSLNHYADNPKVKRQIQWFVQHKHTLYQSAKRATPYLYFVFQEVKKRHLPAEIVLMPMIESAYNPYAYSNEGAAGLWQMMPGTASGFGIRQNWWYDGRRDIDASTNAALNYLAYLQNYFNGNWLLAIAAYDTGEGNVLSSIRKNTKAGLPTDFFSLPLSKETQAYIPKLLALAEIISHPDEYPIKLPYVKNSPYLKRVDAGAQINLKTAAKLADLPLKELMQYNPGFNRWATSPKGPHTLLIPVENVKHFMLALKQMKPADRVTWQRYVVQPGDTLEGIANKFSTSTALLYALNQLKSDTLSLKQRILVPLSNKVLSRELLSTAQHYLNIDDMHLPGPKKITHFVVKGDSLWEIARRYHTSENAIRFWNTLSYNQSLKPGQTIIIWTPIHYHNHALKTIEYFVKKDDTLGTIAEHYHTNTDMLRKLNSLPNDVIQPGQTLTVIPHTLLAAPVPRHHENDKGIQLTASLAMHIKQILYIVNKHDTLSEIASHFKTSMDNLVRWNPTLKHHRAIHPGDKILIYT